MISSRRLIAMARKWQRMGGMEKKAISLPRIMRLRLRQRHEVGEKGHFVAYTIDKGRFVIPLAYLRSNAFKELFRLSEEEFGLPNDGPITFPCDAPFMHYLISLLHKNECLELHMALLLGLPLSHSHSLASSSIAISGAS